MKQDKKGFTLIELLAVIVILAIIALIAVPVVMNIISNANKSAFKDTGYGILKAGELYYAEHLLEVNGMENNVTFEFPNNIGNLQIKGSLPSSGGMVVTKEGKVSIAISNGKYCVRKDYNDIDITIDEDIESCIIPGKPIIYTNGIMTSEDKCIKSNMICPNGTRINAKVSSSQNYDFYVIKDTSTELTLIMNRNIGGKVAWITQEDYTAVGGNNWGSGNNEKGPLTALKAMEERTSSWGNVPATTYTLTDDSGLNRYSITRNNVRVRMISYTEAEALGCTKDIKGSCPNYLYENLSSENTETKPRGYWVSTVDSNITNARTIHFFGLSGSGSIRELNDFGIRPVITLSKNL